MLATIQIGEWHAATYTLLRSFSTFLRTRTPLTPCAQGAINRAIVGVTHHKLLFVSSAWETTPHWAVCFACTRLLARSTILGARFPAFPLRPNAIKPTPTTPSVPPNERFV